MSTDQRDLTTPGGAGPSVADAVAEGLAAVRLEGLEPDAEGMRILDAVTAGRMTFDEARRSVLAAARPA